MPGIAKRLTFCMLIVLCAFRVNAQVAVSIPLFYEKVYLHTDRDLYLQGDDIWFKAYLVNAQNNKPVNYSHNLYVELISPGSKIITRHVLRMEDGLGNGDFKLADTLSAGIYRLRAYTNWMRNFGDKFVFEKNITIINTSGKKATTATVQKAVKRLRQKPVAGKQDTLPPGPMVSFYPEGGSLIDDVSSVVAVKAEDEFGRGVAATGQVFASSDRMVAKFTCDSLGFGSFTLEPDETQLYRAEVMIKGQSYTFKVKHGQAHGFTLSASAASPFVVAEVSCNSISLNQWAGSSLVIEVRHGGKLIYKESLRVQLKDMIVQIPDANLPEGIVCVTLFDEHARPLAERLVYVHHPNDTKLSISTDSAAYHSKQKVEVKIKLSDNTKTNLSLAAVDAGLIPVQTENIALYLKLRSEIKGTIEHPERYFDTNNPNRAKQLDLLLLTQGWRDFIWKDMENAKFKPQYDVEQAIPITGKVRGVWLNRKAPNINITMFAPRAAGDKLFTTVSDSSGHFRIDGAILYGYQYLNFTSRNAREMGIDGKSKGKSGGWVQVDSLFQDRLAVSPANIFVADTINTEPILAKELEKQKFSFSGINPLKTVQITTNSEIFAPEIHPITLTEQKEYGSLMQYLLYMIPNSHMEFGGCRGGIVCQNEYKDPGFSFLETGYCGVGNNPESVHRVSIRGTYTDHSKLEPACDGEYLGLPMSSILQVSINKFETPYNMVYSANVVMRPGVLGTKDFFDNTMADVVGYTRARVFYAPRYTAPDAKPDYRTTIHWEPNITTDAKGEATVSFYNADPKSKISIVVQGITDKGVPVVATANYTVK
jgi:hypothetical protein